MEPSVHDLFLFVRLYDSSSLRLWLHNSQRSHNGVMQGLY